MSYRIEENGSGFSVYPVEEPVLETTEVRNGQVVGVTRVPLSQAIKGYRPSTFDAWYNGDGDWSVDVDCGFQRWYGHKSTRQVCAALRKCGFDTPTIRRLMRKCREN